MEELKIGLINLMTKYTEDVRVLKKRVASIAVVGVALRYLRNIRMSKIEEKIEKLEKELDKLKNKEA